MDQIAEINIEEIAKRLESNQSMNLDVTHAARTCIGNLGYDIRYGARPLKRALTSEILNPLSKAILEGYIRENDLIRVVTRGEALNLRKSRKAQLGWVTGANDKSTDRNDVVILKNHEAYSNDKDSGDSSSEEDDNYYVEGWGS